MRGARGIWRKGFTLVELITVLAIVSLVAAIAVPTIRTYQSRARTLGDAALLLKATLTSSRVYAIQNRVRTGVFFPDNRSYFIARIVRAEEKLADFGEEPLRWMAVPGDLGRIHTLPSRTLLDPVNSVGEEIFDVGLCDGYPFDATGTLEYAGAMKGMITLEDQRKELASIRIEILRATGRVRIK